MPSLTKEEKNDIKETIETDICSLKEQMAILEEKVKPIPPDCSLGRLTRLEAMGNNMSITRSWMNQNYVFRD